MKALRRKRELEFKYTNECGGIGDTSTYCKDLWQKVEEAERKYALCVKLAG